ncbi:MAG: dihydroneopterin aldolase [Crocinitomicaceae bacterium]|nr:dihydroneopterin aldolase [Crocinitomicaceae bacterium]
MINKILVEGIKIYAFHGCLEEEAKIGSDYIVDVAVTTNFMKSTATDDLDDTIDYVEINQIVEEEMEIRSKLIEHVAYRILNRIKQKYTSVIGATVKVTKICPPINGNVDNVAVIIEE